MSFWFLAKNKTDWNNDDAMNCDVVSANFSIFQAMSRDKINAFCILTLIVLCVSSQNTAKNVQMKKQPHIFVCQTKKKKNCG